VFDIDNQGAVCVDQGGGVVPRVRCEHLSRKYIFMSRRQNLCAARAVFHMDSVMVTALHRQVLCPSMIEEARGCILSEQANSCNGIVVSLTVGRGGFPYFFRTGQ
jgi:hypothetical protein